MKITSTRYILAFMLVASSMMLMAQPNKSYYFLEGSTYGHQANPAFMPERNYVSIPVLGNINVGVLGNVGLSDFIYDYNDPNGKYSRTTFLSPTVDANTFLGNINTNNLLELNLNLTPVSVGFYNWGGYNTIELGIRSNTGLDLPYELFNFIKNGATSYEGTSYSIQNLRVTSNTYANLSLGHSRKITDDITVGAKLKLIAGIANIDANLKQLDIYFSKDKLEVQSDASMVVAMKGANFETESSDKGNRISGLQMGSAGISGFGFGADLGITYKLLDDALELSASALDLGIISWSDALSGQSDGSFTFEGFEGISLGSSDEGSEGSGLSTQIEALTDDITSLASMYEEGTSSATTTLATTLNVGAKYKMPFYEQLSVGLLGSARLNGVFTYTEARLYANVSPLTWVDLSLNGSYSNYGAGMGWVVNIHPKGFNFFVGSDMMPTKVSPQFLPINQFKGNVFFGMNITFGSDPTKKI